MLAIQMEFSIIMYIIGQVKINFRIFPFKYSILQNLIFVISFLN